MTKSYLKKLKHHVIQVRWDIDHCDRFSLLLDCQEKHMGKEENPS